MKYRADIDGLRAIAVICVLVFHGAPSLLPSGFIGVDIFFVISGFLITSIIAKDIDRNSFSFSDFYRRRLWRLQPAFLIVMLFTLLLAFLLYLPDDLINYLKSAKYTSLLISNRFFSRTTTVYGATDSTQLLLLHTWSLSIEWQWYLLLPISIWLLFKYCNAHTRKIVVFCMLPIAVALSFYIAHKNPSESYYSFLARIFEFLIGVYIALLGTSTVKLNKISASAIGTLALIVIIYCALQKNIVVGYPDKHAIAVSVSSAIIILLGLSSQSIINRILAIPPLVFIGKISYSLYLWHWPIFAAGRYLGFKENYQFVFICYALTLFLAYMSYIFIEKRFRNSSQSITKSLLLLLLIPIAIIYLMNNIIYKHNGFPIRFGAQYASVKKVLENSHIDMRAKCFSNTTPIDSECTLGSQIDTARSAMMIGDSFANHMWGFIDVLAKDGNVSVIQRTKGACLALPNISLFDWRENKGKIYQGCNSFTKEMFEKIKKNKYQYVILGQDWDYYLTGKIIQKIGDDISLPLSHQRYFSALDEAIRIIEKTGATPIIIKATYWNQGAPQYYCYQNTFKKLNNHAECIGELFNARYKKSDDMINLLKTAHPNLLIIDPKDVQCNDNKCVPSINKVPMFRDETHITDYASTLMGLEYLKILGNPFKHN